MVGPERLERDDLALAVSVNDIQNAFLGVMALAWGSKTADSGSPERSLRRSAEKAAKSVSSDAVKPRFVSVASTAAIARAAANGSTSPPTMNSPPYG
jgi:hypothetical protein